MPCTLPAVPETAAGGSAAPAIGSGPSPRQYFGGTLRSSRSHGGLTLSEVDYDRRRQWLAHSHLRAFFALLLRGSYAESTRTRPFDYRALDLGFHPEAMQHTDRIEADGTRFLIVELDSAWIARLSESAPGAALDPRRCDGRAATLALALHREYRSGAPASSAAIEGLVLELLADLAPASRSAPRAAPSWLPTVLDMIRDECPARLSLVRIAREVRLHPVYLSRSFRERTGRSVSECLRSARIRFAVRRLASPEASLSDIALDAGFADQSHFTKVFRREIGTTPGAFRASLESGTP